MLTNQGLGDGGSVIVSEVGSAEGGEGGRVARAGGGGHAHQGGGAHVAHGLDCGGGAHLELVRRHREADRLLPGDAAVTCWGSDENDKYAST